MRLLLCSERLWLDSFWHNRLAYWNRNITVRWVCSWLQKCVCLNRNVPCNLLKHLLWAWKSGLLEKTYTDTLVLGSQDTRASGDTGLGEGTCVHEPFWIDNTTLLEAGGVRKAGFWDMLLTEVTGTEQGAGVTWSAVSENRHWKYCCARAPSLWAYRVQIPFC